MDSILSLFKCEWRSGFLSFTWMFHPISAVEFFITKHVSCSNETNGLVISGVDELSQNKIDGCLIFLSIPFSG